MSLLQQHNNKIKPVNETFADCCLISLVVRPRLSVNDLGNVAEVSDRLAAAFMITINFKLKYNRGALCSCKCYKI